MSEETYNVEFRRPKGERPELSNSLGTEGLPDAALPSRTSIWIWDAAWPDRHRVSSFAMAYTLDDNPNPDLTSDQALYILRLLQHAVATWAAAHEIVE